MHNELLALKQLTSKSRFTRLPRPHIVVVKQQACCSADPLQIPSNLDNLEQLNDLLPPPKYPTGLGVAQALQRARLLSRGDEDPGLLEEARLLEGPGSSASGHGSHPSPSRRVRVTCQAAVLVVSVAGLLCTCLWCLLFDCFTFFAWGGQ
jgi:hypothetical protein